MTISYDTASSAATYVARGWAVIPLHDVTGGTCSCGAPNYSGDGRKAHHDQAGKHPVWGNWQNGGLRTDAAVADAWAKRPSANVGIVTGRASGIWVLDVDPDHHGDALLAGLVREFGPLPETYTVRTGSGGLHYYFRMPPDFDFTTSRGALPVGLDVRGNNGQVVAPPSHTLKGAYSIILDAPVVDAPGWLLAKIRPPERSVSVEREIWTGLSGAQGGELERGPAYARAAVAQVLAELASTPPGARNVGFYRGGRRLAELMASDWSGLVPDEVYAGYMHAALLADTDGGFGQSEAHDVLVRAVRDQGGRGVALPAASHLGTPVGWVDLSVAGQGPASPVTAEIISPFTSPGAPGAGAVSADVTVADQNAVVVEDPFEVAVRRAMSDILIRDEARARVVALKHERTWREPAQFGALTVELALPEEPIAWRVGGLLGMGGNAVLVAPRKTGKTTMLGALIRSLVDGVPFLGRFQCEQVGAVALFNYENSITTQRAWLRSLGIINLDRVHVLHLRGQSVPLDVAAVRAWVTRWLRERAITVWMPDPYLRAAQGVVLNENDNGEVNIFTGVLDEIKAEAGVAEIIMPAHAGKTIAEAGAESARGAARLEDWADSLWYLTNVEGQRFLRADGRDVSLDETQLHFDVASRSLTIGAPGKGRREVALERDAAKVSEILRNWAEPTPATQNQLQDRCNFGSPRRVSAAVQWLVDNNLAWVETGPNQSKYHHHGPKPKN